MRSRFRPVVARNLEALPCPVAVECGGCPLIGASQEAQARLKLERVRSALQAAYGTAADSGAGRAVAPNLEWSASPKPFGYRNRIRMRIDERGELGFFNGAKSFGCAVLAPAVRLALELLRCVLADSRGAFSAFAHVEVRASGLEGRSSAYLVRREAEVPLPATARDAIAALQDCGWLVEVAGAGGQEAVVQRYALRGLWWEVPLGAFMQVNSAVNEALVEHAVLGAARRGLQSFVDLYSGAGNFALPLAAMGLRGTAVEWDARAASASRRSAAEQGLVDLKVLAGDAQGWAKEAIRRGEQYDLAVLDPPRAGLKGGAGLFATLARRHILLCSCNPSTLAADLRALADACFVAESVTAFDMFPGTEHLEVAVWLSRGSADGGGRRVGGGSPSAAT